MRSPHKIIPKDEIGDRWEYYEKVTTMIVDENSPRFTEHEVDFCAQMLSRIQQYHETAYVSVNQINWLNRLQQKLVDMGVWTNDD
jgi:hypothetical protein